VAWPFLRCARQSVVRWANIECATEGLAGGGKFPFADESSLRRAPCRAADKKMELAP
jgi:hypothetical protein